MALLSIDEFAGVDRLSVPVARGSGAGREVRNASLLGGALAPLTSRSVAGTAAVQGSVRTGARYLDRWWDGSRHHWVSWPDHGRPVDFVSGLLPEDVHRRGYWTGAESDGRPRMSSAAVALAGGAAPADDYLLGVPRIAQPPTFDTQIVPPEDAEDETIVHSAWVHTLVTDFGEEGPPSLPSLALRMQDGQAITLTVPEVSAQLRRGRALLSNARRRLYRAATGSVGTLYQFVKEFGLDETEVVDDVETQRLGEVLPSETWTAPPDDLLGLVGLPGGVLAGYSGDTLHFSEPYLPHAWPDAYRKALDVPVVALGVATQGLVALTDGRPYLATGSDPLNIVPNAVAFEQGCINPRSVATIGGVLLYAAPDGIAAVDGPNGSILTSEWLAPREWRSRYDAERYLGFAWEGRYVGILDADRAGAGRMGFVLDLRRGLSDLDWQAVGGYSNRSDGSLRLLGERR